LIDIQWSTQNHTVVADELNGNVHATLTTVREKWQNTATGEIFYGHTRKMFC